MEVWNSCRLEDIVVATPLSSEYGAYETVKARFWPRLSDTKVQKNLLRRSPFARKAFVTSWLGRVYRGTSLIRNSASPGPYSRTMPRA